VVLVNKGKGANGAQILKSETVSSMFKDQLLDTPASDNKDLYQTLESTLPEYAATGPLFPGIEKGWMISALLTTSPWPTGRSGNTAFWCGLTNLYWAADPEKGIVNFAMSQMVSFRFSSSRLVTKDGSLPVLYYALSFLSAR
jgi:CubicO group peptidase (beta-lactamase class C family)